MKKLFAIFALVAMTGCASIVNESRQAVRVNTQPQGAEVTINGETKVSPAVFQLKGKSDYVVMAEKSGYRTSTGRIDSEVRILPAVVGNIFNLTGVLGMGVDFLGTGAAYDLDDEVTVKLRK